MKNRKGFTLIELMAVIILLGLIIMIIVPRITDSIENAKKNSAIDSALGYVKSARDYYNVYVLEKDSAIKEGVNWIGDVNPHIDLDGELPSSGYFYIKSDKIEYAEFCVNNYHVTYENSSASATKDEDCLIDKVSVKVEEEVVKDSFTPYLANAKKANIYRYNSKYDSPSTFGNPPCTSAIIYFDYDDKVIGVYYGYTFNTIDKDIVTSYANSLRSKYGSSPWFTENNIYIDDVLSIVFILEHNEYYYDDSEYVDYNQSLTGIIYGLKNGMFGENINFSTPYKTLEF